MIEGIVINKNQIKTKIPIGCVLGSEADDNRYEYKNVVFSYIGQELILIKTNLSQEEWNRYCDKGISEKELKQIYKERY